MAVTPEKLERYIAGNCSSEEKREVEQWILDGTADLNLPVSEEEEALSEVWQRLSDESGQHKRTRPGISPAIWKIAAVLCIALTVTIWTMSKQGTSVAAPRSLVTKKGERKQLTLPDGTEVFLNSESTLKYPEGFGTSSRETELTGEAFFKIAPDATKPFVIHTAKSVTRVLGTQFNLKCYPGDATSISVAEGRVSFSAKGSFSGAVVLSGGESADLREGQSPVRHNMLPSQEMAWMENKLIIDNEELSHIASRLERWYGIEVHIHSPLIAGIRCSGTFINQPAEKVIKTLCYSTGLQYKLSNHVFLIY
ncbi:FecR family protein [Pararcticibacter amylolyticus]|uniref:FecR protein domain-containing protein n=1 Tax=Pararcticibacter amylolyticus TaxID=2173175 RepID=A0A2U2PCY1_9SPHI|nr:FecR domain-containing protein [Pararcticibacter amylolyticus]PWG79223.1 hypothetical protein DDR33_18225 [Pararcticibacter amylolyticus]